MSGPVRRVAIVGDDATLPDVVGGLDALRDVAEAAGGRTTGPSTVGETEATGPVETTDPTDPTDVADAADAVVAVGERAVVDAILSATATDGDDPTPILPVGSGRYAVAGTAAPDAIRRLLADEVRTAEHPIVSVAVDGERLGRAALDVALVTDEPARISEYGVGFPSGRETSVRADGIVVATPLGSDGYAAAAGGSVLEPGTGLSVVPVSPFTTGAETWVVPEAVTLSVERDEELVSFVVDGERVGRVPANEPIRVEVCGRVPLLSVPTDPASRDGR